MLEQIVNRVVSSNRSSKLWLIPAKFAMCGLIRMVLPVKIHGPTPFCALSFRAFLDGLGMNDDYMAIGVHVLVIRIASDPQALEYVVNG